MPRSALRLRKGAALEARLRPQRQHLAARYLLPQPRNALAEAVRTHASAAMDVSDGLAGDLAKLCRVSQVAAEIDAARVPLSDAARAVVAADAAALEIALTGGDDYEILCTVAPERCESFRAAARSADVPVTEIGRIVAGEGARFIGKDGGRSPSSAPPSAISDKRGTPVPPPRYSLTNSTRRSKTRHARYDRKAGSEISGRSRSALPEEPQALSHHRLDAPGSAAPRSALRLRIWRHRRRQRHRHHANWDAFDAIKIVPRYGVTNTLPPVEVELFGRRYAAPIGIAPMGGPSLVWPGADLLMAKAAQAARVPYTLGVAGGATIEEIGEAAPDVFWLQLYRFWKDDHKIGFDLVERAKKAEAKVLALTLDVPVRTTRSRETYAGLAGEFRPNARMLYEMIVRPKWLMALLRNGYPRFATIRSYVGERAGTNEVIRFARTQMGGAFSWDEVARYRERWPGPMLVKGILHPADAEKAVAMGIDGIWVSNHGGRQIEALMPTIDVLPAIVAAVGKQRDRRAR